jgi:hypothetical protein
VAGGEKKIVLVQPVKDLEMWTDGGRRGTEKRMNTCRPIHSHARSSLQHRPTNYSGIELAEVYPICRWFCALTGVSIVAASIGTSVSIASFLPRFPSQRQPLLRPQKDLLSLLSVLHFLTAGSATPALAHLVSTHPPNRSCTVHPMCLPLSRPKPWSRPRMVYTSPGLA